MASWSPREREKKLYSTALKAVVDCDYDKFMDGKPSYTLDELKEKVQYHGEIEKQINSLLTAK